MTTITTAVRDRAVSYSRNSSAEQKSIADQAADNRAAAEQLGVHLVAELNDPSSASRYATKERENWAALLRLLPTIDLVILWEPSRGDRTLASWVAFLDECRQHGVQIHAVSHNRTYDPRRARDYRSLAEDGVDSAYESDKISERTLRGVKAARAKGMPHGLLTYGYRRTYAAAPSRPSRQSLVGQEPDPVTAAVVRDIFTAVGEGETLHSICGRLTRDGVPTPKGGRLWYTSTIASIVRNPAYRPHPADPELGRRAHRGVVLEQPAAWPPLVTETVWVAANRVLGANDEKARQHRRDSAPGQIKYLLSGNAGVMAAPCGSQLTGWIGNGGRKAFYGCRHDRCVSAPMPECDEYVSRLVVARLSRKDARHLWVADETATRQAADELARLQEDLNQNTADYRAGVISARLAGAREAELEALIADAERRSRPAGAPLAALKLIEAAKFGKDRVRPTWDALPVTAKREVIAGLFSSLVLGPVTDRITRWSAPEERLAIATARINHEWRKAS